MSPYLNIEYFGLLALATSRRLVDAGCVVLAVVGILPLSPDIGGKIDSLRVLINPQNPSLRNHCVGYTAAQLDTERIHASIHRKHRPQAY